MLFANSSNFPNIVDKANISFCGSVAFTDTNVPKPLQKFSPRVDSYSIPQSHSDLVIFVVVSLDEWRRDETRAINNTLCPLLV